VPSAPSVELPEPVELSSPSSNSLLKRSGFSVSGGGLALDGPADSSPSSEEEEEE